MSLFPQFPCIHWNYVIITCITLDFYCKFYTNFYLSQVFCTRRHTMYRYSCFGTFSFVQNPQSFKNVEVAKKKRGGGGALQLLEWVKYRDKKQQNNSLTYQCTVPSSQEWERERERDARTPHSPSHDFHYRGGEDTSLEIEVTKTP